MKAIKKLNNNVAYCVDGKGKDVIAFGKGVGFGAFPRELSLTEIERTFYNIDPRIAEVATNIDEKIMRVSVDIMDYANIVGVGELLPSIVFTMADHISFTLKRYENGKTISLPIAYDIQYLFEKEYKVGLYALQLILKQLDIYLPKEEASYIALHIVNSKIQGINGVSDDDIIEHIADIIDSQFEIAIDREDFSYSRFVSHMHYLLKRARDNQLMTDKNLEMFESLSNQHPQVSKCTDLVAHHINKTLQCTLSSEEKMYLLLHIIRLIDRESI